MNAYIVRSKAGVTDKPYVGLFVAANRFELFDAIDEFADPYAFEYTTLAYQSGVLLSVDREFSTDPDATDDGFEFKFDSLGEHVSMSAFNDVIWRDLPPADQVYARIRSSITKTEAGK